jgi:hypothetical protein
LCILGKPFGVVELPIGSSFWSFFMSFFNS